MPPASQFGRLWAPAKDYFSGSAMSPEPLQYGFVNGCTVAVSVPKRFRNAVVWKYCLSGRIPSKIWSDTETIVIGAARYRSMAPIPPGLRASDLCRDRLLNVIQRSERFPASYNKMLIQGAADYCARALLRLDETIQSHRQLLNHIRRFTTQIGGLCAQYTDDYSASLPLLDLQVIEDRFEMIQAESAGLRVLARLSDIPTRELVER